MNFKWGTFCVFSLVCGHFLRINFRFKFFLCRDDKRQYRIKLGAIRFHVFDITSKTVQSADMNQNGGNKRDQWNIYAQRNSRIANFMASLRLNREVKIWFIATSKTANLRKPGGYLMQPGLHLINLHLESRPGLAASRLTRVHFKRRISIRYLSLCNPHNKHELRTDSAGSRRRPGVPRTNLNTEDVFGCLKLLTRLTKTEINCNK